MRYKGAESERKTLWISEGLEWGTVDGHPIYNVETVTWLDEGTPWTTLTFEEAIYNVAVDEWIQAKGP